MKRRINKSVEFAELLGMYFGLWTSIANAKFQDDTTLSGPIIITFEEEDEYSKIKSYLNESRTQFVVKIGNESYY